MTPRYCIVEAGDGLELDPLGVGDEANSVYAVHHGGFAAVVSATPSSPPTQP